MIFYSGVKTIKSELLNILKCPLCENFQELNLKINREENNEIISGTLECKNNHSFIIESGIPRLLAGKESKSVQNAFSQQWKFRYGGKFERESRVFWLSNDDSVKYLSEKLKLQFSKGDYVLDAGCGSGEKAITLAKNNPDINVVAMDFTMTLDTMFEKAKGIKNLYIIQGDVMHPPFKNKVFDKIISIGVLHHTPDTYKSFKAISSLVKEKGKMVVWLYPSYSESPIFNKFYYFFRDIIFLGRGHKIEANLRLLILRIICLPVFLFLPFFLFSGFTNKELYKGITISDLYRGLVFMFYDDISPEYQFRHSEEEVFGWYKEFDFNNMRQPELGLYIAEHT